VAALTAAVAGFVIDFILKEGQGMGAASRGSSGRPTGP
jgi:hypothetical protein